jgi:hypothetical protein
LPLPKFCEYITRNWWNQTYVWCLTNNRTDLSVYHLTTPVIWHVLDDVATQFSSYAKQILGFSLFSDCSILLVQCFLCMYIINAKMKETYWDISTIFVENPLLGGGGVWLVMKLGSLSATQKENSRLFKTEENVNVKTKVKIMMVCLSWYQELFISNLILLKSPFCLQVMECWVFWVVTPCSNVVGY